VGSLSPTVSPQDTLTALEGLILLSEQHSLFGMNWFQNQCWASLLTPCLKVRGWFVCCYVCVFIIRLQFTESNCRIVQ